ncbi:MAG: TrmH family RNA methyltransferase [Candidatus Velthaea sp.]
MPTELSPHNLRIERLRDLRTPHGRREQGRFAIEGAVLIGEALRAGIPLYEIYAAPALLRGDAAEPKAIAPGVPLHTVSERAFARISDVESPSGLLAVAGLPAADPLRILARPGPVLLLAGVADPGNAGTLVRSADAFGAAGVLFGTGGVDAYAPKVVRAAMGSLFRVPVAAVSPEMLLEAAAAAGRRVIAADTSGEDLAGGILTQHSVLAVGNERRGVRDWLPRWHGAVRIPQQGAAESLNAAVAGSILLYELMRARAAG